MKISLLKFSQMTVAAVVIALAISGTVSAQTSDADALYQANSERPLGGFFAKGFTRTFTLLGGGNFTAGDLTSTVANPASGFLPGPATTGPLDQNIDDIGYVISGAMGRRHNHRLRSEIELAIRGNDFDLNIPGFFPSDLSADVNAYSLMKNVIFELPNQTRFTPYAGAGIGISWIEVDGTITTNNDIANTTPTSEVSEEDTAFSYQFIGGVSTRVNQAMDFVVEYRFFGTSDVELDTLGSAPYQVNNLFLGVKLEY